MLRERLEYVVPQKRAVVEDVYDLDVDELDDPDAFDVDAIFEEFREFGRRFEAEDMTVNAGAFLSATIDEGQNVMLEGAQGTLIDIDHGSYPYVTSSNPTAGGAATGTGLSPGVVGDGEVIGIVKAYLTRVGSGPLPTELGGVVGDTPGYDEQGEGENEELANYIREEGGEYGTVTGRPRRVGWLDLPMLRHAARVTGFTGIAVNHLDVLAGLDEVKVGHAYTLDGEELDRCPRPPNSGPSARRTSGRSTAGPRSTGRTPPKRGTTHSPRTRADVDTRLRTRHTGLRHRRWSRPRRHYRLRTAVLSSFTLSRSAFGADLPSPSGGAASRESGRREGRAQDKEDLMGRLPSGQDELELEVDERDGRRIIEGRLIGTVTGEVYPIEDGIPNLLPPDMRDDGHPDLNVFLSRLDG